MADLRVAAGRGVTWSGLTLGAVILSGCAAGSLGNGPATTVSTTQTTTTGTTTAAATGTQPQPAGSTSDPLGSDASALSFDLPPGADYQPAGSRVTDGGAVVRRWRLRLGPSGPYCVVIAGEQPDFRGTFPASAIAAFRAGRDPGGTIEVNRSTTPVRGTVAGVSQQSTYVFSLGTAGSDTGDLIIRQYLTTDGTLISLNAAGPAEDADRCQLAPIVASLRVSSPSDRSPAAQSPTSPAASARPATSEAPNSTAQPTPTERESTS
jgi:hypothetical protein